MFDADHIRSKVLALWNDGDLDVIDEIYAENFVSHDPQNPIQGRAEMRTWVKEAMAMAPDFHIELHETISEGDIGVTRWTVAGTHTNDWREIPATGKHFVVTGITMSKFSDDGKIVESWANADNLGMLQQLGIVPQLAT